MTSSPLCHSSIGKVEFWSLPLLSSSSSKCLSALILTLHRLSDTEDCGDRIAPGTRRSPPPSEGKTCYCRISSSRTTLVWDQALTLSTLSAGRCSDGRIKAPVGRQRLEVDDGTTEARKTASDKNTAKENMYFSYQQDHCDAHPALLKHH